MVSRRQFLRSVAATAAASGVTAMTAGSALAVPRESSKPEHVTIAFDEDLLLRHRPKLRFAGDSQSQFLAMHGWVARSPEYDTDALVYWSEYSHQEGVTQYDSHPGDHEPVYVFRNSSTGDVESIVYSAYHWMRGSTSAPPLEGGHPTLRVVDPWHQYIPTTEQASYPVLADLTASFEGWLDGGLDESLEPGTVVNPWLMQDREHWWRENGLGFSMDVFIVRVAYLLGIHNADESQPDTI